MNILRKAVTTLGGIVLAALLIAALAPKAAHGIVAALVHVGNTSANPVPVTQGVDLASEPFATMLCTDNTGGSFCTEVSALDGGVSPPASFTVPSTDSAGNPVKALVIQFVSAACDGADAELSTTVPANGVNGVTKVINSFPLVTQPTVGALTVGPVVGQTTSIVAGPGSTVGLLSSFPGGNGGCLLTVNGYLAH